MSKSKTKPNQPEPQPNLSFIDVHCHLPMEFAPDGELPTPEVQYEEFFHLGGVFLISCSIDWNSLDDIRAFVKQHPYTGFTCGWGPQTVTYTKPSEYSTIWNQWKEYVRDHPEEYLAIGEIGLDFHHAKTLDTRERQVEDFRTALEIAQDLKKPIVLHVRNAAANEIDVNHKESPYNLPDGANKKILAILKEYKVSPNCVMWHCFSGPAAYGSQLAKEGFWLSVPSSAWGYPKWSRNTGEVPITRLLTETDASFQHPWKFGPVNEPSNVRYAVAAIANTHKLSQQSVSEQTIQNAITFFHLEGKTRKY